MRFLWTMFKVIIGLAIAIPLGILALALTLGVLGTLVGLAILAIKLLCLGFVGYGLYRVARALFAPAPKPAAPRELTQPDPYYDAAMRELDRDMGYPTRR